MLLRLFPYILFTAFNAVCRLCIKGRVKSIEIAGVDFVLGNTDSLAEPLEVNNFPFPQKPDCVFDIRVIHQPEDVVI